MTEDKFWGWLFALSLTNLAAISFALLAFSRG